MSDKNHTTLVPVSPVSVDTPKLKIEPHETSTIIHGKITGIIPNNPIDSSNMQNTTIQEK